MVDAKRKASWGRYECRTLVVPFGGSSLARAALERRDRAAGIAPDATFRSEYPTEESFSSVITNIVRRARRVAGELDAGIVFIGNENVGRVSKPLTSIGAPLSSDPRYDVHIVRHAE